MIEVTLDPPVVEQTVTIKLSFEQALSLRKFLGKQTLTVLDAKGVTSLWNTLHDKVNR